MFKRVYSTLAKRGGRHSCEIPSRYFYNEILVMWSSRSEFLVGFWGWRPQKPHVVFYLISQRAGDVTSPAWLAYSLPLVFFFLSFLLRNWSQPLLIRSPKFFYRLTCHDPGLSTQVLNFENLTYLLYRVQKTAKNAFFHVFFTGWPHVFDRCAKTVCAKWNAKTNVIYDELSFIRYNND